MEPVHILRRVFWWVGWIGLAFSAMGIFGTVSMVVSQPQSYSYGAISPGSFITQPMLITLSSLPFQLAFPALMFFAWGILTVLEEVHERLDEAIDLLSEDDEDDDESEDMPS